jgi:hypothetical protein
MDADDALTLFPDLPVPEPGPQSWEVQFTVRCRAGFPLAPVGVPSGGRAMACWTAERGEAVAVVEAADEMAARAAGAEACPGWAELQGVTVTVRGPL